MTNDYGGDDPTSSGDYGSSMLGGRSPQPAMAGREGVEATEAGGEGDNVAGGSSAPVQEYRAEDFAYLNEQVPPAVRDLFGLITRFKPQTVAIDSVLRPFIPEYIPALGEIDEFIKVPRPDGQADGLGTKVLDEPALKQSERSVLQLQLRNLTKVVAAVEAEVEALELGAPELDKRVAGWVQSVEELHKQKPPAEVTYTKRMPELDVLMQEWPHEVEQVLRSGRMPDGTTPLELPQMIRTLCGLLDIPCYYNLVESLHCMFSLYLELKSNPFLKNNPEGGPMTFPGAGGATWQLSDTGGSGH